MINKITKLVQVGLACPIQLTASSPTELEEQKIDTLRLITRYAEGAESVPFEPARIALQYYIIL